LTNDINDNNSGHGRESNLPDELRGLNWGAFFFTFVWGVPMRVPWAWLCLIPFAGDVFRFVLLIKGNEWAWQGRKWKSITHFRQVQTKWAWAVLYVFIIMFIISLFIAMWLNEAGYSAYLLERLFYNQILKH